MRLVNKYKGEEIETETKGYIYDYLGRPEDHKFDIEDYKGTYGGLINIIGLRHKGVVIAANTLYKIICNHYDIILDRWDFMHELQQWCADYVGEDEVQVGKRTIIRGLIDQGTTRYVCVPPDMILEPEIKSQVTN